MFVRHQLKRRNRITMASARKTLEALEGRVLLSWGIDPSFGSGGMVKGPGQESYEVEVQSDGKLVVADDAGLIRYNANGSLDTTFGGGDGIADWGDLNDDSIVGDRIAIALLPSGKIIAANSNHGSAQETLIVARYNSDGTRDTTFGPNGEVRPSSGVGIWKVADVDVVSGGKILIGGDNAPRPFFNDFSITRLNPDGTPDTTFGGGDGRIDRGIRAYDEMEGLLVQRDGKIVAFGNSATARTTTQTPEPDRWEASLFRLHGDGSLDTSFGAVGKAEFPDFWQLKDAELQSTGKIVLLTEFGRFVRRLNANGTPDLTFGGDGQSGVSVSTNTSSSWITGNDLLVQSDDSVLMGGRVSFAPRGEFAQDTGDVGVGRILANGDQDGSFGPGFVNLDFGGNSDNLDAFALQNGKIIAAGVASNTTDGTNFTRINALARISEGGSGGMGTGLNGEYFNNMDFTAPAFTRTDPGINFNWGTGSPDPRVGPDTFSVRWSGEIKFPTVGTYTFYTTTDDGVRLTVNGQRIIDHFTPQAATEWSGTFEAAGAINGRRVPIVMEYFERYGGALAKLQWSGPGISGKQVIPASALFAVGDTSTDNQPPSVVPNFHIIKNADGDVGLAWDKATDNVGVDGYELSMDNGARTATLGPNVQTYTFSNLAPGSTHTFGIHAFDIARNNGPTSTLQVTTNGTNSGGGLAGSYFNNMDFTSPAFTRTDPNINFNWGTGSPDPRVQSDTFSVRWSGRIIARDAGNYTFYTTTDDGVRLTVDGERIIDHLTPQASTEWSGSAYLFSGGADYNISMEYFERFGGASAKLEWSGPGFAREVVPQGNLSPQQPSNTAVPVAPQLLSATGETTPQNETRVRLGYQPGDRTSYLIVERAPGGTTNFAEIDRFLLVPNPDYVYFDDNLPRNTSFTYRLRAWNDVGYSPYSNSLSVTTPA